MTILPAFTTPDAATPKTPLGRWLLKSADAKGHAHATFAWYRVIWLTGVDYFSTLGYQPGIALLAAGAIAPLATIALVLVTLFAALPIYLSVARRSYLGHGSVSMLEKLLPGWAGKVFVLCLLGFATTDFVITMTLSAADAAAHLVENPFLHPYLGGQQLLLTLGLLVMLGVVFLRGFHEAIGVATWIAVPYLVLNAIVIGKGALEIMHHPEAWANWERALTLKGSGTGLIAASILAFPKLALGLSGFETGVSVMPLIHGAHPESGDGPPVHRIAATRKLLIGAAVIMSGFLIASSFVTTLLIPESAWRDGGDASGRALAWVAHEYLGDIFGTCYDLSTVLILWFAGASAMAAMLSLIPRYLPRFGMAPHWVGSSRPLVLVLLAIDLIVTIIFDADVEAQGGAYATGVLALILSGSVAVTLAFAREAREANRRPWLVLPFALITLVFAYTFIDNVIERPDGIIISSVFIIAMLLVSAVSRYQRATEFRVERVAFATPDSELLWKEVQGQKVSLVAVKQHTPKEALGHGLGKKRLKRFYAVEGPLAYIHIDLAADRSAFDSTVYLKISRLGDDFRITVSNATAIANTIAYLSEAMQPKGIFLGLTRENPVTQAVKYLLWGEGETGILVYQILLKYWASTPQEDERPHIFLMSD
jgi:hypothetical protein